LKAQALSRDIPARGGTFLVQPREEGRSVLPLPLEECPSPTC
jgi:hypothetical protein